MLYPANIVVIAFVLVLMGVWLGFLLWAQRTGQLRDPEAAKHRVFEDGNDERRAAH